MDKKIEPLRWTMQDKKLNKIIFLINFDPLRRTMTVCQSCIFQAEKHLESKQHQLALQN
jgi:hypothetical protein